jgi:hypothetical protein
VAVRQSLLIDGLSLSLGLATLCAVSLLGCIHRLGLRAMTEQTSAGGATLCAHFLRVVGRDHGSLKPQTPQSKSVPGRNTS